MRLVRRLGEQSSRHPRFHPMRGRRVVVVELIKMESGTSTGYFRRPLAKAL